MIFSCRFWGTAPGKTSSYGFEGPSAFLDDKLEQIKVKKIKEKGDYAGNLKWIALENRYFLSSIIPETFENAHMRLSLKDDNLLESRFIQALDEIAPGVSACVGISSLFWTQKHGCSKGIKIMASIKPLTSAGSMLSPNHACGL